MGHRVLTHTLLNLRGFLKASLELPNDLEVVDVFRRGRDKSNQTFSIIVTSNKWSEPPEGCELEVISPEPKGC